MIWALPTSPGTMNADKRPRFSGDYVASHSTVIVLSDDDNDEPPRKRQKSLTPARPVGNARSAKPDAARVNGVSSAPHAQHEEYVKKSPWRNKPTWSNLSSSATLSESKPAVLDLTERPSNRPLLNDFARKSDKVTQNTEDRLRRLSLSPPNPRTKHVPEKSILRHSRYGPTEALEAEGRQILGQFKLVSSTALKFNPNNPAPSNAPSVTSSQHQQPSQQQNARHNTPSVSQYSQRVVQSEKPYRSDNTPKPGSSTSATIPVRQPLYTKPSSSLAAPVSNDTKSPILTSDRPQQSPLNLSINVPLSETAKFRQRRKALQEKLKEGTEYAKAHPELIEKYLGLTGFADEFSSQLNLDEEKMKNAAQPKKRIVDRSKVSLSMLDANTTTQLPSETREIATFIHPKDQVKNMLVDRFSEHVDPPLTFFNDVNDRRLDGKFQFISEYILRKGVKAARVATQPGCTCTGTTGCDSHCACLMKTFKDNKLQERVERIPQYKRRPDGLVVLRNDFIQRHEIRNTTETESSTSSTSSHYHGNNQQQQQQQHYQSERVEISECNENCPCDPKDCINRVVQNGRTVPLEIFETARCGFGVRSPWPLARGQFIEVYLGEVITENELERREAAAEAGSHSFVYSLDWFSSHQPYQIDGQNFGSAMRFVNHSCEPNAASFPVLNHKANKQLHYNAFFATRDIPAGTEITIDYTPQAAGETYELRAADEGMERCYCGSKSCRQMLWLPGKERRSRKKLRGKSFD